MSDQSPGTIHIIGGGLAGLSTALGLSEAGRPVVLYEAAGRAGGRCRSFFDEKLGCLIDNGNHLLFSGNLSALQYIDRLGAWDQFETAPSARFSFADLEEQTWFAVELNASAIPLWILDRDRRVPGTSIADHRHLLPLLLAKEHHTVADLVAHRGALWRGFVEPLTLAAINTVPEQASARLLRRVLSETFFKGGAFCRPIMAREGLGPALIDPALRRLGKTGVAVHYHKRLRSIEIGAARATHLHFGVNEVVELAPKDWVVVALPPDQLAKILPAMSVPDGSSSIINAHFRVDPAVTARLPSLLGVLGAKTQWIFVRPGLISLTISGADALGISADQALGAALWSETCVALRLPAGSQPIATRILTEKRATFLQTPQNAAKRLPAKTHIANLVLAGDATQTGLPATIEGALRSGKTATDLVLAKQRSE